MSKLKKAEQEIKDVLDTMERLGKAGNPGMFKMWLQAKGYDFDKGGRESLRLSADDYFAILEQAERDYGNGVNWGLQNLGRDSAVQAESNLLPDELRMDSGQEPQEEGEMAALDLSDLPD